MTADPKQVIFGFVYHFRCSSTKVFQLAKFQLFVLIQKLGEKLFKNQFCNKELSDVENEEGVFKLTKNKIGLKILTNKGFYLFSTFKLKVLNVKHYQIKPKKS